MKKKIIIAGGTGFVGNQIVKYLSAAKYNFVLLTRNPKERKDGIREVLWDAKTTGEWIRELEGAEAVINLSGKSINSRYTEQNKKEIIESRVQSTTAIGTAILKAKTPPKVWINVSSATIYPYTATKEMDEYSPVVYKDFGQRVVKVWEQSMNDIVTPSTSKFILRITLVLGKSDGVIPRLANIVRLGLGGKQGSGDEYISWIHEEDFCRIVEWCVSSPQYAGVYNCAAPEPVPNKIFMQTLRKVMGVPVGIPAPAFAIKMVAGIIGTDPGLILESRRVVSVKLAERGFKFKYPTILSALQQIMRNV